MPQDVATQNPDIDFTDTGETPDFEQEAGLPEGKSTLDNTPPAEERIDPSLLSDDERAFLEDDLSVPDTYDDEADDAPDAMDATGDAAQPAAESAPQAVQIGDPSTLEAQLATFASEKEALDSRFQDGEIGDEEYAREIDRVARQAGRVEAKLEILQEQAAEVAKKEDARWNASVAAFKSSNPVLFSTAHVEAFNKHVMAVTRADSPMANLPFDRQLQIAARNYADATGNPALAAPARKAAADPKPAQKQAAQPQAQRPTPPITLARIPSAADNGALGGESRAQALDAMLDRASPDQKEAILSRMSPAEREAYGASIY